MAFMVPVVKKDYDIYSKSPPKNKPIVKSSSNNGDKQHIPLQRQQSNSITIGLLQHKKQLQMKQKPSQRVHSKSVNEGSLHRTDRHRSTSNSSSDSNSSDSLEIIRKMMHFISSSNNNSNQSNPQCNDNQNSNQSQNKANNNKDKTTTSSSSSGKTHWTSKIFRKRKNSLNSSQTIS